MNVIYVGRSGDGIHKMSTFINLNALYNKNDPKESFYYDVYIINIVDN